MKHQKRIFAVSDIHGHYTILKAALDEAGFNPEDDKHLLVVCGDLFDRGRENRKVYDFVRKLKNKVLVCGNHDERLLHIIQDKRINLCDIHNGTEVTVEEFFGAGIIGAWGELTFPKHGRMAGNLRRLIGTMADYYETEHYIFVHGWVPTTENERGEPELLADWRNADKAKWSEARFLGWNSLYGVNDMIPEKTIVCGHRPTRLAYTFDPSRELADSGIYYGENMIAIDVGTIRSGRVNVLVIEDSILLGEDFI